ncbi:alpha/beta fold hydrolase [Paenibacillaceae bacterium WGS1546]|uniref:alpha/beta fold hydrolase n=1 Tax=Cohnella sp. WGS1546 TaxID=3366810 RepID=UPI00372CEE40
MMKQVLALHGAGTQGRHQGSGDLIENLRTALGTEYHFASPGMPRPEDPDYRSWRDKLLGELDMLRGDLLLVGHSLGGSVLLKVLSEHAVVPRVSGLFVVAAPYWGADEHWQAKEYELRGDFASRLANIPIYLYHSRDDEVVPFEHLGRYAKAVPDATVRDLDRFGHAYREPCEPLLRDIRNA